MNIPSVAHSPVITARSGSTDARSTDTGWLKSSFAASAVAVTTVRDALAAGDAKLSFIVPLLNESESLPALYERIKKSAERFAPRHEIIFVDDGSRDGSHDILRGFWSRDPVVTVLRFRKNQGKAAALTAGFERVTGDYVVMMDADLQDQPEEIPKLIATLDSGYDLVTGWKQKRHDPLNKTLPSKLFNGTVSRYFQLDIHDFNCGLKMMRAPVARSLKIYGDYHRFIPVLAAQKGFRVTECAIEHAPRVHGVSKYGAKRLITGMLDFLSSILVTRFYYKPLQMFGGIGLVTAALGIVMGCCLMAEALAGRAADARALLPVMAIMLLGGFQIICLGLVAELIVNSRHRAGGLYDVSESLEPRIAHIEELHLREAAHAEDLHLREAISA